MWKDIAGLLGMGASASAAYTLRKNYTKLILPFECHFDRGGIDPQPIIASLESTSKKNKKNAASVPSPAGTLFTPRLDGDTVTVEIFREPTSSPSISPPFPEEHFTGRNARTYIL